MLLTTFLISDRCAWGFLPGNNQNLLGIPPLPATSRLPRAPLLGNLPSATTSAGNANRGPPQRRTTPSRPVNAGPTSRSSSSIQVSGACGSATGTVTTNGVTTQNQFQFCGGALPIGDRLRASILQGDVQATANLLLTSPDTAGLADGLKVPPGVSLTKSPVDRDSDPDVVTLKSFALASLTDSSIGQITKLVDVFLKAILPPNLQNFDQNTESSVTVGCELSLTSTSTGQSSVQVTTNQDCETVTIKPFEIQQNLIAIFQDATIMNAVVTADADTTARRRALQCTNCRPTTTYVCSFCWPRNVCRTVFWCRKS